MVEPHIYDNPEDCWLVELRVSCPATISPDGPAMTAELAAASALAWTRDEGSRSTVWVVTDRATGAVYKLEQRDFEDVEVA